MDDEREDGTAAEEDGADQRDAGDYVSEVIARMLGRDATPGMNAPLCWKSARR